MILFINTARPDLTALKLIKEGKVIKELKNTQPFKQFEVLLPLIDKLLKQAQVKKEKLRAVAVVVGPGGFSSLRLGIATANALASTLKIPIIEVSADQAISDELLVKFLADKIKQLKPFGAAGQFKPAIPKYGQEPNITSSKK